MSQLNIVEVFNLQNVLKMKRLLVGMYLAVLAISTLTQCKKQTTERVIDQTLNLNETKRLQAQMLICILDASKHSEFREFVLHECVKQKQGDYNVRVKDIVTRFKGNPNFDKTVNHLLELSKEIKRIGITQEPILFYPRAEEFDRNGNDKITNQRPTSFPSNNDEQIIGVIEGDINPDFSSPGYIVDNGTSLIFYRNITEEYAWENDVWVVGFEENVSAANMVAAANDTEIFARTQNRPEYGAIIQVTNLNAIEHWTSGKFEFKIIVLASNGTVISEREFGRWRRRNFKDLRWHNFQHFIANWNTNNQGNWMIENWIEEDGGQSASITISTPPPSGQSGPTVSVTIPSRSLDDNLGRATIQFTDPITQIYNISHANIRRN